MKRILPILFFLCCLPLTGCWGNHEVSDLAILITLGIDRTDDHKILLSGEVFKPGGISAEAQPSASGSTGNKPSSLIISAKGNSIFSAFRRFSSVLPKSLYWSHLQAVVIGENMASEGISNILDTFTREPKLRRNISVYVSKGKAIDILSSTPKLERTLGGELNNISYFNKFHSPAFVSNFGEIIADLAGNTVDPTTGEIAPVRNKNVAFKNSLKPNAIRLPGVAVFKQDRLVGFLNDENSTELLWLKGRGTSKGILSLPCQKDKNQVLNFRLLRSSSDIDPVFDSGKPKIRMNLKLILQLIEVNCSDFHLNSQVIQHLQSRLNYKVKNELRETLNLLKNQWQTDPMGFGTRIYHMNPSLWTKIQPDWRKGGLKRLPVAINVSVKIRQNGLQQSSSDYKGGNNG